MTKQQYKTVQSAQRRAEKREIKLIHLLINYRSHTGERYPKDFISIMRNIRLKRTWLDSHGVWFFRKYVPHKWFQPDFSSRLLYYGNMNRRVYDELPF
jgi:hypothetical protein